MLNFAHHWKCFHSIENCYKCGEGVLNFEIFTRGIPSDACFRSDKIYKIGGHIRSEPKKLLTKINSEVIFGHKKLKTFRKIVIQLIIN